HLRVGPPGGRRAAAGLARRPPGGRCGAGRVAPAPDARGLRRVPCGRGPGRRRAGRAGRPPNPVDGVPSGGGRTIDVLALKFRAPRPIREVTMTRPHHYEHCDVPEGMTLTEYRATRTAAKPPKAGLVARLRRRRPVAPVI